MSKESSTVFPSLCDRLKQRYGYSQSNWQSLFQENVREENLRDLEFIRYIVNFLIEQAKHHIVISELPDVIRTLHCEAQTMLRKNRTITLDEAIAHLQAIGAEKYPYLKKIKPLTSEDFVKEVIRGVFHRLDRTITLDRIENICRFIQCSAEQLLCAMPGIDVDEAVAMISEDILGHREAAKETARRSSQEPSSEVTPSPSLSKAMNRSAHVEHSEPSKRSVMFNTIDSSSFSAIRHYTKHCYDSMDLSSDK